MTCVTSGSRGGVERPDVRWDRTQRSRQQMTCLHPAEYTVCDLPSGGGTGFIGTALTRLLKARGHEVKLVSRQPGPGRITWVGSASGRWGEGSLRGKDSTSRHCTLSHRVRSVNRGCPSAMLSSTWLERTSSTLCEGQQGHKVAAITCTGRRL